MVCFWYVIVNTGQQGDSKDGEDDDDDYYYYNDNDNNDDNNNKNNKAKVIPVTTGATGPISKSDNT